MSASFIFTTPAFVVVSASAIDANTVRVTLSAVPNAFVPANFSIPTTTVITALSDPNDSNSVILSLSPGLQPNNYIVTCSGLTSGSPAVSMTAPFTAAFSVLVGPSVSIAPQFSTPATNPSALTTLRSNIPPSMKGNVWTQLLATLGDEEQFAWDQAAAVYDQLFLVSAEGQYLDARASEEGGYLRPELVGFTDDVFRDLVIQLSTRKLTLNAFLRILEIYYGLDVVRAHVRTTTSETFNIPDGSEQVFDIDGIGPFTVVLHAADFSNSTQATAIETAIALNRGFSIIGASALALPYVDSQTGLTYLTVYTNSRGLRGSIEAVSGPLPFPTGQQTVQTQSRAAYVKAVGGNVEVILPATSIVVARDPNVDAAYVNAPTSVIIDQSISSAVSLSTVQALITLQTTSPHGCSAGDWIMVDGLLEKYQGGLLQATANGLCQVFAVPSSTSLTYKVPCHASAIGNSYSFESAASSPQSTHLGDATLIRMNAVEVDGGPYTHDPTISLAVTETVTTISQSLEANHQYPTIQVASTTGFPDEKGFLVFGWGFDYQVGPVPYLGVSGSTQLLLDPSFNIPVAVPSGATVNLAERLSDDQMPHGDDDFWLTPSPAGRVACEDNLDAIAAGGRDVTKTVVYPGDIGLGGAGLPTHGVPRLTDAVSVWGGDDLDTEIVTARGS